MYKNFDDLNFNDYEDLRYILRQDKHTLIEGICSETAFMEDVVKDNLWPITSDFWVTRENNQYCVYKLITDPTNLINELDYKILDGFTHEKYPNPTKIVYFDEPLKQFRICNHQKGQRYGRLEGWNIFFYAENCDVQKADKQERSEQRIDKACAYLYKRELLKDAAIRRIFANCGLKGIAWNIDALTMTTEGKVVAFEIKHKYPTEIGTFGLNNGQKALFRFLISLGMPVVHLILQKSKSDSSIPGVDFLTDSALVKNTKWLYTRFSPEKYYPAIHKAPPYTSIFGKYGLNYSHMDKDLFGFLKYLGIPERDVRSKLLAGLITVNSPA